MSKPSLILVHGSWHCPDHFGPLIEQLESLGFKWIAVNLRSTQSPELPPATLTDDITAVREAVVAELDRGNDVVVVSHSFGGHITNRSLRGLDTKSRAAIGASTAVLAIAFIAAIPLPSGLSFVTVLGDKPPPLHDLRDGVFSWVGEPGPYHYFYNDLSEAEASKWSKLLRPQSWEAYRGVSEDAAYMEIPSGYLYCTMDNAFPYEVQKGLIEGAIEGGARFVHTETVDSSHSPFLSMPKRTSSFIEALVNKVKGVE